MQMQIPDKHRDPPPQPTPDEQGWPGETFTLTKNKSNKTMPFK